MIVNVCSKEVSDSAKIATSETGSKKEAEYRPWRNRIIGLMVMIVVLVATIDQLSKAFILNWLEPGIPVYIIGDWFRFYLLFNSGAAFSMGQNLTPVFTCIQIIFVLGVFIYARKVKSYWLAVGLALVAGGALGNLIDRLCREPGFFVGHVVDFISMGSFAVFNLADSAITCGVVVFLIGIIMDERKAAQAKKAAQDTEAEVS